MLIYMKSPYTHAQFWHAQTVSKQHRIANNDLVNLLGELEALPMMQRIPVRAGFHKCKQNFFLIQGHLPVFTWFVLRLDSLLSPQAWVYLLFMLLGRYKVRF